MAIVCFDIGGSFIKGAVALTSRDIAPLRPRPTPPEDFDAAHNVGDLLALGVTEVHASCSPPAARVAALKAALGA